MTTSTPAGARRASRPTPSRGARVCASGCQTRIAAAVGALLLVVLAAGCELRAEARLDLDRDGAGAFELVLAADDELADLAADAGIDPLDDVVRAVDAAARDAAGDPAVRWHADERVVDDERASWQTVTVRVEADEPAALRREVGELVDALAAAELDPLGDVDVTVTDDTVRADALASLRPLPPVAELGLSLGEAEDLLAEHVDYTVEVRLPGEVEAAPGAHVDGRTARWEVPAGDVVAVQATGERPPAWPPPALPWALAGAAAGLVLAGVLIVWRRRRARRRR